MVDGLRWTTSSLADFLVAIEGRGAAELPRSLDELARAGVPGDLLEQLRALAAAGNAEADVVRAFYEALAAGIADGAVTARVSRQFVRLLRKQFGRPEECRELRGRVLVLVRAASGEVREGRMIV